MAVPNAAQHTATKPHRGAFTPVFYGVRIFGCKTAQLSGTQREWLTTETPSIRDAVQRSENVRKKSFLN
jgi:hypothetical protein